MDFPLLKRNGEGRKKSESSVCEVNNLSLQIFDQQTLSCNHEADALPCEEAKSFYDQVDFGANPKADAR